VLVYTALIIIAMEWGAVKEGERGVLILGETNSFSNSRSFLNFHPTP
jgi:hypothetical protein